MALEELTSIKIHNVADVVNFVKENTRRAYHPNVSAISLYRGQSNYEWNLLPSVYRNNQFEFESVYIKELERIQPSEFVGYSNFDKLVKMQHYGLPTRLLDVTLNPLVALYFACNGHFECDAAFYYFSTPTFWQDNWAVQIVADYAIDHQNYIKDLVLRERRRLNDYSSEERVIKESIMHALGVPAHAVLPKNSNRRIQQQCGAFMLFGMSLKKETPAEIVPGRIPFCELDVKQQPQICPVIKKIKIPAEYKKSIIEELDLLSVNEGFLFPELEYQAKNVSQYVQRKINAF